MSYLLRFSCCLFLGFTWAWGFAQSCSLQWPPFQGYTFINTNLISPRIPGARLFVNLESVEEYYKNQGSPQVKGNVDEWHERYCEIPDVKDIATLIYRATLADFEQLARAVKSKSAPLPYGFANNSFANYLKRHRCEETAKYLLFAKTCEPYVVEGDPWAQPQRKYQEMNGLIERGEQELLTAESHYIRLRYAYQVIRLAHYSKQYERVLELCESLLPKIDNDPSVIEDWILGHKAGAMQALGQRVEAAYLFARLFAECPSKREQAYYSFNVQTDEEWEACLARCKSPEEEATLFAIRGSFPNSKLLVEMRNIYERDPDSPYLPLFLIQEMRKLEKSLLGASFNSHRQQNQFYYGVPAADAGQQVIALQRFVNQVIQEKVLPRLGLWHLSAGYLAMLAGNAYDARKAFDAAAKEDLPKILEQQLEAFELALYFNTLEQATFEVENDIAHLQAANDVFRAFTDFKDFSRDKLTQLYQKGGHPGKAFLMQYPPRYLRPNIRPELLEDLLRVVRKQELSRLEQEMVADGDSTILQELLNLRASYFMREYKFEAALETLKQMGRADWDNFGYFNPFVERIRDCVHCPLPANVRTFNKGELIEALLDKEYQARAGTGNTAVLYYEIGLALYNMSYFGQAWDVTDFYRSGGSMRAAYLRDGDDITPHPVFPYGNQENLDCSRARLYFERARLSTDSTELAAKATFMAAKCERNDYYTNRWRPGAVQTFENFEILVQNYSNTAFYERILEECLYFNLYANR